jgi:hydrogenase/urease accessory protein HupE
MMRYLILLFLVLIESPVLADELRPAYLQISEQQDNVFSVLFRVPAKGQQRLSLDVLFDNTHTPVNEPVEGFVKGSHLRQWQVRFTEPLAGTRVAIKNLDELSTEVLLRIEYRDGTSLTHRLTPAAPSYIVAAKPTLAETAYTYLVLGIEHILLGIDHLLFVLALLLLIDNTRKLILTITAFTVAHSITLSLASLQIIHIPVPPVEAIIALSIVFVAAEIIRVRDGHDSLTYRKPWIVAFAFGLLHGLGFAAALGEIGLPENAIVLALVLFNVGVETGQLLFVFAYLVLTGLLSQLYFKPKPLWQKLPPYMIGSLASFWAIERTVGFWN